MCIYFYESVAESNAHKETEKNLRVLKTSYKQFIEWIFQHLLITFVFVIHFINVNFDLHSQNLNLFCLYLYLIWLAVER